MAKDNYQTSRRNFIRQSSLTGLSLALGAPIVFADLLPKGLLPIGLLEARNFSTLPGKSGQMIVLNERPVNAETPPHLLDAAFTPNDLFFVRNNGIPPENVQIDNWTLTVEGESVQQKKTYSLAELKSKFPEHTLPITLECGGNGRSEFSPPAKGNQWSLGAVGCAQWTGVKLADVLQEVGLKNDAVYLGYYGDDDHLSGKKDKQAISRGVPITKALAPESLIAWKMNGDDLPLLNGYPLRLVFGGFPASCSGKWLKRIVIRNKIHDGTKMGGQAYRVPCNPVAPGAKVADEDMCIIEEMPVKSLITYPKTGATIKLAQSLSIRGKAWTGSKEVQKVEWSIDFGSSWSSCQLQPISNRFAWQTFGATIRFPKQGYYEVWARATDEQGRAQPIILPGWNPKGYLNNACHRIAIKVV